MLDPWKTSRLLEEFLLPKHIFEQKRDERKRERTKEQPRDNVCFNIFNSQSYHSGLSKSLKLEGK